ncbi:uncharacterized protein LOC142180757 [Nicotiana tabacum]|uniref:Uncharacterized protein LOC142180757 n=1 Tax=Nicotiana tabacum TaxID=4097 RepID=A0AC58UHG5_TOBAC
MMIKSHEAKPDKKLTEEKPVPKESRNGDEPSVVDENGSSSKVATKQERLKVIVAGVAMKESLSEMKCRNRVRKDESNVVVFEDLGVVNFMDKVDKSWMHLLRWTDEYIRGVNDFLDKAFERASQGNEILCPCQKCINHNWHYRNVVEDHLVVNDFVDGYTEWVFHSEGFSSRITPHQSNNDEGSNMHDDIDGLLHDTFRNIEAFSDLLELLKEAFPLAKLPESFNKVKNMIKDLGLHYEKIHACPNDCMLFWNDNAKADNCSICGSSRWKSSNHALTNTSSKVPAKVLRHPADGEAWKDFDSLHPDFSKDPRNVRLGLSSDGFNPFRTMSISHSTWLVMLMNYNLSPWICMKPEYIMLSMIIPGPSSPGNDIDVYLQPLIAELKELWETGIETYDAKTKQTFQMRAALLWIINNFPALAMLSGWSTKGSLLGTLLEIEKKSKDHVNARYDLKEMGIREELQPREDDDGSVSLAKACFYMEPKQKSLFCTVIKNSKLPKGCASNITERVQVKEMKISGYKSHDAHFIMHYLLQVTVRKALPKSVSLALIRLGNFFRAICSKVIRRRDLEKMNSEIVEINCELEKIFHLTFFDIMPHLPIHLVNEIKLGSPAHLHWMYPIERNLCKYKAFVRNRSCLEASIAEGFLAEECLIFCSRYLHNSVKTRFSRYPIVDDECPQHLSSIFPVIGHPIGSKKKNTFLMDPQLCYEAHRYALFNTGDEQVEKFIEEHKNLIGNRSRSNAWERARNHSREFNNWFAEKVKNIEVPNYVRWLAKWPNAIAKRYTAYFINGYRFHTIERDSRCKTQNNGVTLSATTDSFASSRDQNPIDGEVIYYRAIQDIIEINYWGYFSVVLFRCDWFRNEIDEYGLTRVYFKKLCSTNDPFVLASQVYQVFYVEDPAEKDVYYARNKVPVDLYDLEIDVLVDVVDIPSNAQHSHDTIIETSEEENKFDDTDWD